MTEESRPASNGLSRREIAGATMGGLIVPRRVLGAGYQARSDTPYCGIGVGGIDRHHLQGCANERTEILCDISAVFRKYPQARVYTDFRRKLAKEENLEAVIVPLSTTITL